MFSGRNIYPIRYEVNFIRLDLIPSCFIIAHTVKIYQLSSVCFNCYSYVFHSAHNICTSVPVWYTLKNATPVPVAKPGQFAQDPAMLSFFNELHHATIAETKNSNYVDWSGGVLEEREARWGSSDKVRG